MTELPSVSSKLPIGHSLGEGVRMFFLNFGGFAVVAFLIYLPAVIAIPVVGPLEVIEALFWLADNDPDSDGAPRPVPVSGLVMLGLLLFLLVLSSAAVADGVRACHRGHRAMVGAMIKAAQRRIGTALVVTLGVAGAAVPGILIFDWVTSRILWLPVFLWSFIGFVVYQAALLIGAAVLISVCALEARGAVAGIRRLVALTKGNRWRVLGFVLLVLLFFVIVTPVSLILVVYWPGFGLAMAMTVAGLILVLLSSLFSVLAANLYVCLAAAKEGHPLVDLTAIFD